MKGYASNTGTRRNLDALRCVGWSILLTPDNPKLPFGFSHGLDNGAWGAFQQQREFDERAFMRLYDSHAEDADFVVVSDIVAGGLKSLDFSLRWLPRLESKRLLIAVQDGMDSQTVTSVLMGDERLGIFLGGSTPWKLETMKHWGELTASMNRYFHVGRVNTRRRIRLCAEAGADSFDGTSATMFSCTLPMLEAARQHRNLFTPPKGVSVIYG